MAHKIVIERLTKANFQDFGNGTSLEFQKLGRNPEKLALIFEASASISVVDQS